MAVYLKLRMQWSECNCAYELFKSSLSDDSSWGFWPRNGCVNYGLLIMKELERYRYSRSIFMRINQQLPGYAACRKFYR